MFSLGHIQYARWLPVFLEDFKKLAMKATPSWNSSIKGTLLLTKLIVLFQVWVLTKHMNKTTIDGRATGILKNEIALK